MSKIERKVRAQAGRDIVSERVIRIVVNIRRREQKTRRHIHAVNEQDFRNHCALMHRDEDPSTVKCGGECMY